MISLEIEEIMVELSLAALEASARERADPTERERAESGGEAAAGEEDRPVGGSGSRLSWIKGGQRAGGAGGGGATGEGAAGGSAKDRGWRCRRSRAPLGGNWAETVLGGPGRGGDCR